MKERIQKILHEKQLTSARFADLIEVQRSSISHILSGRNKPSMDFLEKILITFPEINGDWLITGRGAMYKDGRGVTSPAEHNPPQSSPYKSSLFDDSDEPRQTSPQKLAKQADFNAPAAEQFIPPKPTKVVKRVVIYYDDNSYDELFLNK